ARENNLRNVSVDLPKRRLTAFTGVSGSGKSSLVFATIAAESQRMINETYSAFLQGFMPALARPDVDVLEGLTTAIVVDQERMGSDPRSTVGTATDTGAMLRLLFSRLAEPHLGGPKAYSFNVPSASGGGAGSRERAVWGCAARGAAASLTAAPPRRWTGRSRSPRARSACPAIRRTGGTEVSSRGPASRRGTSRWASSRTRSGPRSCTSNP